MSCEKSELLSWLDFLGWHQAYSFDMEFQSVPRTL